MQVAEGSQEAPHSGSGDVRRGGQEVTSRLIQRDEESEERGSKGSQGRECRVSPHLGPPPEPRVESPSLRCFVSTLPCSFRGLGAASFLSPPTVALCSFRRERQGSQASQDSQVRGERKETR